MTHDASLRYEHKFLTDTFDVEVVAEKLRRSPGGFREEYPERRVQSLYFDTRDLTSYRDHVNGLGERDKVRVRWYGEGDVTVAAAAVLEVKGRQGALVRKSGRPFVPKGPANEWDLAPRQDLLPVITVSYSRRYFVTPSGVRATIDFDLRIADGAREAERSLRPSILLEMKFRPEQYDEAATLALSLGWPRIKHSKYVRGVRALALV